MPEKEYKQNLSISEYVQTVCTTLIKPENTLKKLSLNIYQLCSYLLISAFLYALIANLFTMFSPFVLLILSPVSVMPHTLLISASLYIIFGKLKGSTLSFKKCFKISSYLLISLIPFMAIIFTDARDNLILITIKTLPFIYFAILLYHATSAHVCKLKISRLIMLNMLDILIILLTSTLIFTINICLIQFIGSYLFGFKYIWRIHYF